jgi:hypothetical protein
MFSFTAKAWRADWLSGWLAAVGVTVLCEGVRLSWTEDAVPLPVFWVDEECNPGDLIASCYPSPDFLAESCVSSPRAQVPTIDEYSLQADLVRAGGDWLWSATFSDLGASDKPVVRSLFYPGAQGKQTLNKRIDDLVRLSWANSKEITQSMDGTLDRSRGMGLGFDPRRLVDPADPNPEPRIDPIVEVLAFFATLLFPVRGNGRRRTNRGASKTSVFDWDTWNMPLDVAGIDAFLGSDQKPSARFSLVPYKPRSTSDPTAGYFSKRVL